MANKIFSKVIIVLFFLVILFGSILLFPQDPVILERGKTYFSLKNKVWMLEDRSLDMSINDILSREEEKKFRKLEDSMYSPGMTKSAYWIMFSIKNGLNKLSGSPLILEIENPNIHYIDFYQIASDGSVLREKHTGTMRPVKSRDLIYNKFVFYTNLPKNTKNRIFVRFQSESSLKLNFSIREMTEFMSNSYKDTISSGIFLGLLIIMFGYNLFLFLSIKEKLYLYFSLSIASLFLFFVSESGIGQIHIWPKEILFNYYMIPVSIVLLLLSIIKFTDFFIDAKKKFLNFHKIFNTFVVFSFFLLILIFILGYYNSIKIIMIYSIFILIIILTSVFYSWREGDTSSGYFLMSYIPIFFIGIFSILEKLRIFPLFPNTDLSKKLGSTFFILVISLAIAERIKKLKREKTKMSIDLKESEDRFRDLVENSYELISEMDESRNFTYISPNVKKILGFSTDEVIGKNFSQFLSEDDKEKIPVLLEKMIKNREPIIELRNTLMHKDGSEIIFETNAVPFFSESKKIIGLRCINRNISKRVKAEYVLRESEERFKTIVENSHAGIINVDDAFCFTYVNPMFEQLIGYSLEELIGKDFRDFLDEGSIKLVSERYKKRQAGEDVPPRYIFNVKRRDGNIRRVEISSSVVRKEDKKPVTVAQLLDITEKERSEKMKEIVINISEAVNYTTNMNSFLSVIHSELNKIIDSKNFFVGLYDKVTDTISFPYIKDEKDQFERVPAKGTISSLVIKENRSMILRPNDIRELENEGKIDLVGTPSKIWLGVPLRLNSAVIGIIVIQSYKNETDYDRSDLELMEFISGQIAISINKKQSEEKIRVLSQSIEQGPAIVLITDLNGNIEYVNRKFEEITGYGENEAIGKNPRFLQSGDTPRSTYTELWSTIISGNEWRGEFHNKKKDGTLYWESVFITCIRNTEGDFTNYLAIKNDITDKKRMEQQLIQAQKMESIGTLAGGIAHDFNNLLTVINGYSDMLLMKFGSEDTVFKDISAIRSAGDRAEKLTRQIMAFSRKQIYKPQIVDINSIIIELEKMFRSLIGEDIDIRTKLAHDLPFIKADPGQIEQILINLLVNARDAVNLKSSKANEKRITIETNKRVIDEIFVKNHIGSRKGVFICLAISDSGIGMNKEIKNSIFEPFFTTKSRNKGTGLGLATVYGIVKQNSGSIYVYSEPGMGTTFKIYWPTTDKELTIRDSSVFNRKALSGNESILVVEDDIQVLNFAKSTLQNFGYNVHSASSGKKALKIFKSGKIRFNLLFTDLVMPDMNGQELAAMTEKISPETKILFASGYTDNHLVHKGQLKENINFLSKPYSTKNLLKAIREILDLK